MPVTSMLSSRRISSLRPALGYIARPMSKIKPRFLGHIESLPLAEVEPGKSWKNKIFVSRSSQSTAKQVQMQLWCSIVNVFTEIPLHSTGTLPQQ
jgi:hypothetical protein